MAEEVAHNPDQFDFDLCYERLYKQLVMDRSLLRVSLDFRQLKDNVERIKFVYNLPLVHKFIPVCKWFHEKSAKDSTNFRSEGNRCFQNGANQDALHFYTRSVLKAPEGRPEQALAFANRSAALFHLGMFNLSLRDIEEALTTGYPAGLTYKLLDRKARCLVQLARADEVADAVDAAIEATQSSDLSERKKNKNNKKLQNVASNIPEESLDREPTYRRVLPEPKDGFGQIFISASPAFSVSCSEEKGRYAVATRDIDIGEVIVVEEPYAATLQKEFSETHCDHCMVRIVAPLPCGTCSGVGYCSHRCRDTAWSQYHSIECSYLGFIRACDLGIGHLALRMVLTAGLDTVLQCADETFLAETTTKVVYDENRAYRPDDYTTSCALVNHADKRSVSSVFRRTVMAAMLLRLLEESDFFKGDREVTKEDIFHVGSQILRHTLMLPCNTSAVHEMFMKAGRLDKSENKLIGSGIFNTASLLGHSCFPSAIRVTYGRQVVVRAIRSIRRGEEISLSYGILHFNLPRLERQTQLKEQFFFECRCEACVNDWPADLMISDERVVFKCAECGGPMAVLVKGRVDCRVCSSQQVLKNRLARLSNTRQSYNKAMFQICRGDSLAEVLPLLLDNLKLLESELYQPTGEYLHSLEAVKSIYDTMGSCFSK